MVGTATTKGAVSKEEREELRKHAAYFRGKTLADNLDDSAYELVGDWFNDILDAKFVTTFNRAGHFPGVKPNWTLTMGKGMRGLIQDAEDAIKKFKDEMDTDIEKLHFYNAVIIVCKALIVYANRYAALARQMAETETSSERAQELLKIADICEYVPENPPRTFHEAVQFIAFIRLGITAEVSSQLAEMGRIDQDLYPFFEKDVLIDRSLSMQKATDLMSMLIGFFGTHQILTEGSFQVYAQLAMLLGSVTIGGVTRDGKNACNELTYLVLHAAGLLRVAEPHVAFRWNKNTPREYTLKAIETNVKVKGGTPQFMNDEHTIKLWTSHGESLEDARDWFVQGCANPQPLHRTWHSFAAPGGTFNLALILDLALHNGVSPITGKKIGIETGDPRDFNSMEELFEAIRKQEEYMTSRYLWCVHATTPEKNVRRPFMSAVISNIYMDKGKDMMAGDSSDYAYAADRAIVDVGDSLYSIRKLVFDDRVLTMDELIHILDSDFVGERGEEIRQMCLAMPKFGNDIAEVDDLVGIVGEMSAKVVSNSVKKIIPEYIEQGVYRAGLSWHQYGGAGVGALPNGRHKGEPLYDGSFSPMAGMDTHGPTAMFNSVFRAKFPEANTTVLNQKFSGSIMQSKGNQEKLTTLTEAFLDNGGQYIQYNILDPEELRDAQVHPDKHRDLLVRVGGFNAYFVTLTPPVQEEIITRSMQAV